MRQRTFSDNWNFWTVKYLRQVRHNFSLLVFVGVLLLVQFLIFRSYLGETPLPRKWPPWWLIALLFICGIGTVFCVGNAFGCGGFGKKWQMERKHFTGFAPIRADALFLGCLYSFLLTFGILYASCLFSWGATILLFPEKTPALLLWSLDACLLSLILLLLLLVDLVDGVRPELFWLVGEFLLLPVCEFDHEFTLTLLLLWSAFYLALLARQSLPPAGAVREVAPRLAQIGFLGVAVPTKLPETAVVLAAGALASMGSAVAEIPHRQLKGVPGRFSRRLFAWLLYGSSAGGWLWSWGAAAATWGFLISWREKPFALFLVSWGLASAEAGFLLASSMRRCPRRRMAAMVYQISIPAGWLMVGVAFAMIAIASGIDGTTVFRAGANWGWAAAALLLLPNLPRLAEDFRKIVLEGTR